MGVKHLANDIGVIHRTLWTRCKSCGKVLGMASDDTARRFGERLEAARKAAGGPSYRSLEREVIRDMGIGPSNQTIANYHHGLVDPANARLELVVWFAERYGVRLADLSELIAERFHGASDVLTRCTGWLHDVTLVA